MIGKRSRYPSFQKILRTRIADAVPGLGSGMKPRLPNGINNIESHYTSRCSFSPILLLLSSSLIPDRIWFSSWDVRVVVSKTFQKHQPYSGPVPALNSLPNSNPYEVTCEVFRKTTVNTWSNPSSSASTLCVHKAV